jgi:cation:H+ antiporter
MGALISSKVNQWTLLVGTLPIAFALSSGTWELSHGLPLDHRQREELFLTAAQSAFAIAVFLDMRMSKGEAWTLFILFGSQLFITNESFRIVYGVGYLVLCAGLLFARRQQVPRTLRDAWGVARGKLAEPPEEAAVEPKRGESEPGR